MPQRASFDYANPASVEFLPSDQDSTINVSTATANVHYRTGGGWSATRTITVEGTPADGLKVVVSNNSGQSIELANGTGAPLDVGTLPLVIRDGEWVGLVTNASTSKLIDATGAVGLDARGDLASQNTVTVAQISDPENLNAAQLGSASATDGYVLKADGSGGTAWEAESGGGSAAEPALPWWRTLGLDATQISVTAGVTSTPSTPVWSAQGGLEAGAASSVMTVDEYTSYYSSPSVTITTGNTLDGNDTVNVDMGSDNWLADPRPHVQITDPLSVSTSGALVRFSVLVRHLDTNDDDMRLRILNTDNDDYIRFRFENLITGTPGILALVIFPDPGTTFGQDANQAVSVVTDATNGDGIQLTVEVEVVASSATLVGLITANGSTGTGEYEIGPALIEEDGTFATGTATEPTLPVVSAQSAAWSGTRSGPVGLAALLPRPTSATDVLSFTDGATTLTASVDGAGVLTLTDSSASDTYDASSAWTAANAATPLAHWLDMHVDGTAATLHLDGTEVASITLGSSMSAITGATLHSTGVEVVRALLHSDPGYTEIEHVAISSGDSPVESPWIVQYVESA